ncbi:MAG: hypothetical protein J3R72DRAFT_447641 [Linnemannia gamsii]|nr:MAG: hypothetical protein J3R72DRAFT_447641 [Linnemannia gamsii]
MCALPDDHEFSSPRFVSFLWNLPPPCYKASSTLCLLICFGYCMIISRPRDHCSRACTSFSTLRSLLLRALISQCCLICTSTAWQRGCMHVKLLPPLSLNPFYMSLISHAHKQVQFILFISFIRLTCVLAMSTKTTTANNCAHATHRPNN